MMTELEVIKEKMQAFEIMVKKDYQMLHGMITDCNRRVDKIKKAINVLTK